MKMHFGILIASILVAALPAQAKGSKTAKAAKTVSIENIAFSPTQVEVQMGDIVEWTNKDIVPHTVTATDKSFDSGNIAPGASWKYTVKKKGTVEYKCNYHPNMVAKLTVQ
jgi:plastocyanin